jgi:hypothetical protein
MLEMNEIKNMDAKRYVVILMQGIIFAVEQAKNQTSPNLAWASLYISNS